MEPPRAVASCHVDQKNSTDLEFDGGVVVRSVTVMVALLL